ncbi:MAG: ATP-binding protein [Solobacterium sp.]|nr:ATP-binding protein [Solobacterium sp.]
MNIRQAKDEIRNAVRAYLTKDAYGQYEIPVERQRPLFLYGPPGIGKTAVMEQIAGEMDIALVAYSMTHHTRQSALGLPFILHKTYGNVEVDVSEYTMSEIIASIYEVMEKTGKQEGILFLDEINCVSETLSPAMLEFLQYKIFGRHRVPEGWVVATAGNPPEYNHSVHEYDVATWDRLKRIDVEPDFEVWKEYALKKGVHPAVMAFLDLKKEMFYLVESAPEGKRFVTARGWEDLSAMLVLYERNEIEIGKPLIAQYLQHPAAAKEFAHYFSLFCKYRSDYQVEKILKGTVPDTVKKLLPKAKFDEQLSLIGLLLDYCDKACRETVNRQQVLSEALKATLAAKNDLASGLALKDALAKQVSANLEAIRIGKTASSISKDEISRLLEVNAFLEKIDGEYQTPPEAFALMKKAFEAEKKQLNRQVKATADLLAKLFDFADTWLKQEHLLSIIVSEMTVRANTSAYISRFGCPEYFAHNKNLLFTRREKQILEMIETLDPGEWEDA